MRKRGAGLKEGGKQGLKQYLNSYFTYFLENRSTSGARLRDLQCVENTVEIKLYKLYL
jgi:hypothetical protein